MRDLIRPDWPARVGALVSTAAMGDMATPEARARLRALLPAEPRWLHQVHGARVVDADHLASVEKADFRFLRFRPPLLGSDDAEGPALPHIRLDRALQFLIGDRLA